MGAHLTKQQRQLAHRLRSQGESLRSIARHVSLAGPTSVRVVLAGQKRLGRDDPWTPRRGRLTLEEREEIALGLKTGESMTSIAKRLGHAPSTVTREVKHNGGQKNYRIWRAHQRAHEQARRPKATKLADPDLCATVTTWLEMLWSPQEIAGRLKLEFPGEPHMNVSHETIYQSLFVQGRGELRKELAQCLRSGRTHRRAQGRDERRGKIPDMVMISERPSEVDDRAVPGHWESQCCCQAAFSAVRMGSW